MGIFLSLKSCKNGLVIRKFSLAKGMFSTKISLTKGIWSKTGSTHPIKIFPTEYRQRTGSELANDNDR